MFDGEVIENVKSFNYLGIIFNRSGTFNDAKNHNIKKATIAMYDVLKKGRMFNLSVSCIYDLFVKIVVPILLHGCEIWGFTNLQMIERLHLKFCKMLLNLKKSTPNYMIYCELGAKPLANIVKSRMINYWSRIVNNGEFRVNLILYKLMLYKYSNHGIDFKWLTCIRNILNDCGLSYIWNDHTLRNFNVQWLNITIKQNLSDQNEQFLSSEMHNSSKATCYKLFKDNINFEDYLDNLNDKDRILLCKYRTTNHRLIIETGRWRGINREDRICNLCNHGLIGDEFHYLLECRHFVISWRKDEDYRYFGRKYDKLRSKRDNKRPSGLRIGLGWVD